jgi:hypothetical protein
MLGRMIEGDVGMKLDLPILVECDEDGSAFTVAIEPVGTTVELSPGAELRLRVRGHLVGELEITRRGEFLVIWANGPEVWSVEDGVERRLA